MPLEVTVTRLSGEWSKSMTGYKRLIEKWCGAALTTPSQPSPLRGRARVGVSVVLAGDALLRDLNRTYRGKDKPTNVLSFAGEGRELGDVILSYETVKREAKEQKKNFTQHTAHLVVHGCLHLIGHDHEKDKDAAKMEKLETSILAKLGFPDPYATTA